MSFQYLRIIGLHAKQGGEALHLNECWGKTTRFVFADAKIKCNKMGYLVLPLYHLFSRNGPLGDCIEIRMDDEIDFSVLGADMIFEILLSEGVVTSLKIVRVRVSDEAEHRLDVRVVGVGDFFHGRHISFADGLLVV